MNAQLQRMTVPAREMRAGDRITLRNGDVLTVAGVDWFGVSAIVDFTDGTATAPVPAGAMAEIERPCAVAEGSAP